MAKESTLDSFCCLSDILDVTCFAGNAVDEVGATTRNVYHGVEFVVEKYFACLLCV